ncbi:MAG TPA: hypothetical protein PLB68_00975 [Candidatus Aminicenantes bacterium]|nr:hypothetical protein [Candidatus Aminicenantes bacterium]HPB54509.1 hypothetical protein [Candidatus Aminicenantes bacterium]
MDPEGRFFEPVDESLSLAVNEKGIYSTHFTELCQVGEDPSRRETHSGAVKNKVLLLPILLGEEDVPPSHPYGPAPEEEERDIGSDSGSDLPKPSLGESKVPVGVEGEKNRTGVGATSPETPSRGNPFLYLHP